MWTGKPGLGFIQIPDKLRYFLPGQFAAGHYALPAGPATDSQRHIFRNLTLELGSGSEKTQQLFNKVAFKIGRHTCYPDSVGPELADPEAEGVQNLLGGQDVCRFGGAERQDKGHREDLNRDLCSSASCKKPVKDDPFMGSMLIDNNQAFFIFYQDIGTHDLAQDPSR